MKNSLVFLFIPPIIKSFVFSDFDKIKFLEFNLVDKKKIREEDEICFSFADEENDWKEIEKELAKQNKESRLVLVNYPNRLGQFSKVKELLLKENVSLQKHLVIVSVSNYKVIEEIKKDYFLCPECEIIHPKKSLEAVDETLFCPFNKLSFNSKKIELFNEQIVSYYLENTMLVIKEFIDDNVGKMVNKVGIQITRREELGNELRQKILSAISNVELDFIEND